MRKPYFQGLPRTASWTGSLLIMENRKSKVSKQTHRSKESELAFRFLAGNFKHRN